MSGEPSILRQLEDAGRPAPRMRLRGERAGTSTTERYEVLGEIGRGAFGVVHKGRDADLGREVALKFLREDLEDDPDAVRGLVEEAQIGGQLQHPGIVPLYELGLMDGRRPYFAMRLVKGETLAARFARRSDSRTDRRRLLEIFLKVCQTLAYAHARGVAHLDLKPANVMLGTFGEVQVVDWGAGRVLARGGVEDERMLRRETTVIATLQSAWDGEAQPSGSVHGTPAYLSPEQALGYTEALDERSDVFSLGAILCEILTGRPPYGDDDLEAAARAQVDDAFDRLDEVGGDPDLVALCKRALSPVPKDRPAGASVLAAGIQTHLDAAEQRVHRAEVAAAENHAAVDRLRRGRRLAVVGAAAVLGLILLGGWIWRVVEGKRADQERRHAQAFEGAMQEAARHLGAKEFADATGAVERARALADPSQLPETAALARKVGEAQDAAVAAQHKQAEDAALLFELEEIVSALGDEMDEAEVDQGLTAALAKHSLQLDDALGRRWRASEHPSGFAALLEAWSMIRHAPVLAGSDWRKPARIARIVEPDAAHDALRAALNARDVAKLQELLADRDVRDVPETLLPIIIRVFREKSKPDAACELARKAVELHPGAFSVQMAAAPALKNSEHIEEALCAYRAAVSLRPRSWQARHFLGIALEKVGDLDGALRAYRAAVRVNPGWGHALGHEADVLLDLGRIREARRAADEAVRLAPEDAHVRHARAKVLRAQGEEDEAFEEDRAGFRYDRKESAFAQGLMIALRSRGDVQGAKVMAAEAVRLAPERLSAWTDLGGVLHGAGDFLGARVAWEQCIRLDPSNVQYAINASACAMKTRSYAIAVRILEEAVRRTPGDASLRYNLAAGLKACGRLKDAEAALREAIRLKPDYAEAHCNLARILEQQLRFEDAVEEFKRGHELGSARPDWPYPSGEWLEKAEKQARTMGPVFEKLSHSEVKPNSSTVRMMLAMIDEQQGRYVEAARLCAAIATQKANAAGSGDAGDLELGTLVLGAQCAARAAAGEGEGADKLSPEERASLRAQALRWLTASLEVARERVGDDPERTLRLFGSRRADAAFASIRDADALAKLPKEEADALHAYWREVETRFRKALQALRNRQQPPPSKYPEVHLVQGEHCARAGDIDGALKAFREAARLDPTYPRVQLGLATMLRERRDTNGAITALHKAAKNPKLEREALSMLGSLQFEQGDFEASVATLREVTRRFPGALQSNMVLSEALASMHRYEASLEVIRHLRQVVPRDKYSLPSLEELEREAEIRVRLAPRLDELLAGHLAGLSPRECVEAADLARLQRRFADSASAFVESFARDPALAEDVWFGWRLRGARAAAQAAVTVAAPEERARWRTQARAWMRAFLDAADLSEPRMAIVMAATVRFMKRSPDFASVRDEAHLRALPQDEADACRALWADAETLYVRAMAVQLGVK